jgi:hypothetical protein
MNAAWHHMFGANPRKTRQVSLRTHVWFPWGSVGESEVAFASLAAETFNAGYCLYKYRPKYHLGVHLALDIHDPVSVNPASVLVYV